MEPQCDKCKLFERCQTPKMKPYGDGKIPLLIVGEAPGRHEDARGIPFIGQAGRLLETALDTVEIKKSDVRIMNAVNCRPPNNKTPTDAQIRYCRPMVLDEIERFKPNVILCLGASAAKSIIGASWGRDFPPLAAWRGLAIPDQKHRSWVVVTYHPAFLLRNNDAALSRIFMNDILTAIDLLEKPLPEPPEPEIQILTESPTIRTFLRKLVVRKPQLLAFDYETNMLKPYGVKSKIISASVAFRTKSGKPVAYAFPMYDDVKHRWVQLLKSPIPKVAANMKYEIVWSRVKLGVVPENLVFDTMLWGHFAENFRKSNSLKFHVYTTFGVAGYDDAVGKFIQSPHPEQPNRLDEFPILKLLEYNALDSFYTLLLAERWRNED